ncbi:hypothetical protein TWF696_003839 [Orbilia brochopaga]|uniref:Uncharacterized protein n=1 Tax=Orbilia brochopaga TaxID=3140254 RepID=A0AAV9V6N6_9PEZI
MFYVVIHVATTCDEHGVYVTKDSAEVIEIGWILLNAKSLEEVHRESVLVRPVNTPITPLCTSLTTLTWEHVRNAGTFRDAINRFDSFVQEYLSGQNNDFTFVTLDAWDLRVQLPREARDKAVVLPPYLQHSRTFDLRTEYTRWQSHHPESLPFGPSSLANICAALEVEPVQSSAPIKHNLPFHLQALAPASPRRAMEEAITLARVLRGLIKKSQPPEQHPDVLARPMDARADVRAFLSERSKVLHMSGLPHDTTQSELESWFTQYGGRPIAFWTLRTPDQHKPTGTGFAVFSSHEEAAESLCMNGRALNEKAIEVSPSSSRVLDRAADILTPFPPSKNRPRPGDWTCPSCGFSNFQRRTACFRCSYPAVSAAPGGGGDIFPSFYPPSSLLPPAPPALGVHGHSHGIGRAMSSGGSMVPFRAGDWKCGSENCGYHNFAKNVSCLRCGASRAGAAVVADTGYSSPIEAASPYSGPPSAGLIPPPAALGSAGFHAPAAYPGPQYAQGGFNMGGSVAGSSGFSSPIGAPHMGHGAGAMNAGPFDQRGGDPTFGGMPAGGNGNIYSTGGMLNEDLSFLSNSLGGLGLNDEPRQRLMNGTMSSTRSPAM